MNGRRRGGLWHDREFLKLWSGETVSQIGSQVTQLALPLTAVYELGAGSVELGLLNAASYAPFLGASLVIGVWVDRRRRRPLMMASSIGRAILVLGVPLLAALGMLGIGYLYATALAVGVLTVLFDISYQSYLPALIHRNDLVEGNSKMQASSSVAQIGGPGLGGLLVGWFGGPKALLVDACSYAASFAGLAVIHRPEPAPTPPRERVSIGRSIAEGMRLVFGNRCLRACALESGTYNFFWLSLQTVFVLYAVRTLHLSPGTLGVLFGAGAVGSLVGAVGAGWLERRLGLGPAIVAAVLLCCLAPILMLLAPGATALGMAMYLATFSLSGLGATLATVHIVSLRQAITPAHTLGRVNACCRFLAWGPLPLGALFGGFLGEEIGLRPTLFVTACGFSLALLWVWFSPVAALKDLPVPEPPDHVAVPAHAPA